MKHWSLDDIAWNKFEPAKAQAQPDLISLVKAAALVEHNGYDYARYLCEVFPEDTEFKSLTARWAEEEVQHGQALRKWAELADPTFDFDKSFKAFTDGYKLPMNVKASVRGSKSGELIARCVVETGTSSYYTAIKEYAMEPVLQQIAGKIAADELRHWKLFYTYLKRYLEQENITFFERLKIALGRMKESEDDELAYAFYAAHHAGSSEVAYDHKRFKTAYMARAMQIYRRPHIDIITSMMFKTVDLSPHGFLSRAVSRVFWQWLQSRSQKLEPISRQAA